MADDFGFQPTQQSQPNDFGFQPVPEVPDISGVQKMAKNNLTTEEVDKAKPLSPMERMNVGSGMPVDKIINGTAQPSDINAENRAQYVKALNNGSAVNSSDWMQTALHAVGGYVSK